MSAVTKICNLLADWFYGDYIFLHLKIDLVSICKLNIYCYLLFGEHSKILLGNLFAEWCLCAAKQRIISKIILGILFAEWCVCAAKQLIISKIILGILVCRMVLVRCRQMIIKLQDVQRLIRNVQRLIRNVQRLIRYVQLSF